MTVVEIVEGACCVPVEADSNLEELGLDSLELLEVQTDIEKAFSIRIPDGEMAKVQTVADLIAITDKLRNVPN